VPTVLNTSGISVFTTPNLCSKYRRPIIEELNDYNHLDIVQKAIFDYHCKRLYNVNSRMALNNVDVEQFEKDNFFKYHYYSYIKESYNQQFSYAKNHLYKLKKEFRYLNPSMQEEWIDIDTQKSKIFTGQIQSLATNKIYIISLGKYFYRFKSDFEVIKDKKYYCNLVFTVKGIRANLISQSETVL